MDQCNGNNVCTKTPKIMKYAVLDEHLVLKSKTPPTNVPDRYVSEMLFEKLRELGDKTLLIEGSTGYSLDANEILSTVEKIASSLLELGVREGDVIFGYCSNNTMYACSIVAAISIACVFTGCMYTYPSRDLEYQLRDSEARVILCCNENLNTALEASKNLSKVDLVIVLDTDVVKTDTKIPGKTITTMQQLMKNIIKESDHQLPILPKQPPNEAVAVTIYSSGSTGDPKGVLRTNKNIVSTFISPEPDTHFLGKCSDVITCHSPLAHTSGCMTILCSLFMGRTVVINNGFQVDTFLSSVEKYKVTFAYLAPSYIVILTKSQEIEKYNLSSLKEIVTGGAPLPDSVVDEFVTRMGIKRLFQVYGMTECGLVTANDPELTSTKTCGRPQRGVLIKFIDRTTGQALGPNQTGELYIKGPENAIGYFKNPQADAENLTPDGWIKSGDAGYFDDDGLIYIVDRYKEVIKVDTLQVAPSELESVLLTHDEVSEAAVVGVPDSVHGEVPKAFVVPKDTKNHPDADEIRQFVNEKVASFKQIKSLHFVKSLPKISLGKMDRVTLKTKPQTLVYL